MPAEWNTSKSGRMVFLRMDLINSIITRSYHLIIIISAESSN
jgi:hypothetical protein